MSGVAERASKDAWLVVMSGPREGRGRMVRIGDAPLLIGRDPECAVRSNYPGLSRRHAQIERRGDALVIRDLGSRNGTALKGQVLRGEESVIYDRARIAIGPLRFAVVVGTAAGARSVRDETIVEWLRDDEKDGEAPGRERSEADTRLDLPRFAGEQTVTFETLRAMVIEDVLVVSPRKARLDGEAIVEDLRRDLQALAERGWPKRVVMNLVAVDQIGTQAVGLILAHALGLERQGGALRLCQVNPRVLAVLERIKVTEIVETLNTLDDAVLARWGEP
jgi:anti-anti-sigma factor